MESSSSRPTKLNLKAFITPLPRLGSIDALELNALKSDRERSSMDCPKCNERLLCDNCCRYYKGDPVFKAPGCEKCKKRYEKEIDDAKTELATLRLALRDNFSKQIMAYEDTQKRLADRLLFLKLQDPDPANEVFKGDVSLVVHGIDLIHAHRFILVRIFTHTPSVFIFSDRGPRNIHRIASVTRILFEKHLYIVRCTN